MVHFLQGNLLLATPVPPQAGKKGRAREPKFARMDSARERESERERERERCTLSLYNLIYPYILMYIHMHRYISESQPAVSCRTSTYSTWRIISLRKWLIICCWKAWFRCPRTRIGSNIGVFANGVYLDPNGNSMENSILSTPDGLFSSFFHTKFLDS